MELPANREVSRVGDAGSNQRPLPCEGSKIVCWTFLQVAKPLQKAILLRIHFPLVFRRFTRVAAQVGDDHLVASSLGSSGTKQQKPLCFSSAQAHFTGRTYTTVNVLSNLATCGEEAPQRIIMLDAWLTLEPQTIHKDVCEVRGIPIPRGWVNR